MFRRNRSKQPSIKKIERSISEVADRFGYGNVWLFGNYYEGLYNDGCPVQVMLDSAENPKFTLAFSQECYERLGLETVVYFTGEWPEKTQYILDNSRLIHHA